MKSRTIINIILRFSLALALFLATSSSVQAQSVEPAKSGKAMEGGMMEQCKEMKAQKQKMGEDMKAQDTEMTERVAKMNSAPDGKKMGVMAAVITHMLEQRVSMDARKAKMEETMMAHMMQHMQMGTDSMSQCPMMKEMNGKDKASTSDHKGHKKQMK